MPSARIPGKNHNPTGLPNLCILIPALPDSNRSGGKSIMFNITKRGGAKEEKRLLPNNSWRCSLNRWFWGLMDSS
jgi:hypothetical protein